MHFQAWREVKGSFSETTVRIQCTAMSFSYPRSCSPFLAFACCTNLCTAHKAQVESSFCQYSLDEEVPYGENLSLARTLLLVVLPDSEGF